MHNGRTESTDFQFPPAADEWWQEVLAGLAPQLTDMAADFTGMVTAELPAYRQLPPAEVTETARRSFTALIARLAGRVDAGELRALSEDLGRRRAAQSIPLDDMLAAIRLDFRVLWDGLIRSIDASEASHLLAYAEEVLRTVDEYSSYAQRAYLAEEEALAADAEFQTRRLLTLFLSAGEPAGLTDRVAELTGFDPHALYTVWTVRAGSESDLLHRCGQLLRRQRLRYHWAAVKELTVIVIETCHPPEYPVLNDEPALEITPITGSAQVPTATARGLHLIEFAQPGRWSTEREVWVPFMHNHAVSMFPCWQADIVKGFDTLAADERERVIDTVLVYLSCGSTQRTAESCYVHRNTVLNRMRLFRECTGLDVTVPIEASAALLALGRALPTAPPRSGRREPLPDACDSCHNPGHERNTD